MAAIRANNPDAMLIAPTAIQALVAQRFSGPVRSIDAFESCSICHIEFRAVPASHPTLDRDEQGGHKYLGFILRVGQFTIYHSGDTVVFPGMGQILIEQAAGKIDLGILPINGKVGNMNGADAARLGKAIGTKLVIPCHYDLFEFNTADPREQFVPECARLGQPYRNPATGRATPDPFSITMSAKFKIVGINFDHMHMGDLLRMAKSNADAGDCGRQ